MDPVDSLTAWFAAARAVHFSTCLLIFAVFFFSQCVVGSGRSTEPIIATRMSRIARGLLMLSLPLAAISGGLWFGFIAITMSDLPPREALQMEVLRLVWNKTQFGYLWKLRAGLWGIASCAAFLTAMSRQRPRIAATFGWIGLISGAALAVSLAWAGHGGSGTMWHLANGATHILISGVWPVGLLPLALLLFKLRSQTGWQEWQLISRLIRRFSTLSLISVALIILTGVFNSTQLVGSWASLVSTIYGVVLLAKIALFLLTIGIGAVNLLHLKPRFVLGFPQGIDADRRRTLRRLQVNVWAEIALAGAIMSAVGLLGLLPPAAEHLLHHHH